MHLCCTEFSLISKKSLDIHKIHLNRTISRIGHSAGIQGTHKRLRPSLSLKDFIKSCNLETYMEVGLWQKYGEGMRKTSINITLIKGRCVIDGTGKIKSQKNIIAFSICSNFSFLLYPV